MAQPSTIAPPEYIVRLPLPESLLGVYEAEAERLGQPLERVIADHLRKTKSLVLQQKPIIVTDSDRHRIDAALKRNFNDGAQLAAACEALTSIWVGEEIVQLPPAVIERLKTRCYGMPFQQFVQQEVRRLLEIEVGLR